MEHVLHRERSSRSARAWLREVISKSLSRLDASLNGFSSHERKEASARDDEAQDVYILSTIISDDASTKYLESLIE